MTTIEKLSALEFYMVGPTVLEDPSKKFIACTFYQSLEDYGYGFEIPEEEKDFEAFYSPTMEELIDEAYKREQELKG